MANDIYRCGANVTYAVNLDLQHKEQFFMIRISARSRIVSAWTNLSGNIWYTPFTYGYVFQVNYNGGANYTRETTTAGLTANSEFYYDHLNQRLYIYITTDPNASIPTNHLIASFRNHYSNREKDWYETPTDSATETVHWEPYLLSIPETKQAVGDQLLGFAPITSTTADIANTDHKITAMIHDSSFYKTDIEGWHVVGDLTVANLNQFLRATVGSVSWNQERVTFQILDSYDLLNQEFRTSQSGSASDFYNISEFPATDPSYIGKPKRRVYGYIRGLKIVNIDYTSTANLESDNAVWGIYFNDNSSASGLIKIDDYMAESPTMTYGSLTNKIYFTSVVYTQNFLVGDTVELVSSFVSSIRTVTAVDYSGKFITINTNYTFPDRTLSGNDNYRANVPRIFIEQNNVVKKAVYGTHYTLDVSNGLLRATFIAGYQASLGLTTPITHYDSLIADVYGIAEGSGVGAPSATYGVLTTGPAIIYQILLSFVGIAAAQIDIASFAAVDLTNNDQMGFAIPQDIGSDYPTYIDIINKILLTSFCRLFINNENKWSIAAIEASSVADDTIYDDDIVKGISCSLTYSDIAYNIILKSDYRERGEKAGETEFREKTTQVKSNLANYLHKSKSSKTFSSYNIDDTTAESLANKLLYVYGDRKAQYKLSLSRRFFDALINDRYTISREKLPGFTFLQGTERVRTATVTEVSKGANRVTLILDDQKGLDDNT